MSQDAEFKTAVFTPQTGPDKNKPIKVHFNPTTLKYSITNTLDNKGSGNSNKQYVSQSSSKLSMDLVFDTTHDGQDVRVHTEKIARFMMPGDDKIPPIVLFEWGLYKFQGMLEAFNETLDFFAPTGVPLRSSISLTLANQDKVFEPTAKGTFDQTPPNQPFQFPTAAGPGGGAKNDPSSTAAKAGAPEAARQIAAANNQESLRFSSGASLSVSAEATLGGPVAFSSAAAGTFAGLRTSRPGGGRTALLNVNQLMPASESFDLATDSGASFQLGGAATIEGSTSLSADVGTKASLRTKIEFDI